MVLSDTINNLGIVEQVRSLMRVDSTQWPTWKIVNSVNNHLDVIAGYLIGADKRFRWDDTNHTKLPEGTTDLNVNQSDYSFLTDEQNNKILTLIGISILVNGYYQPIKLVDRTDPDIDVATFGNVSGTPTQYDKIADNIIRLDRKSASTVSDGIKFYFQRTPSYFTASDATKEPGVPALLHRGFVIAAAYDGALTLGLPNLGALGVERQIEERKLETYFAGRDNDEVRRMVPARHNTR